jgi:hypothetical protein
MAGLVLLYLYAVRILRKLRWMEVSRTVWVSWSREDNRLNSCYLLQCKAVWAFINTAAEKATFEEVDDDYGMPVSMVVTVPRGTYKVGDQVRMTLEPNPTTTSPSPSGDTSTSS